MGFPGTPRLRLLLGLVVTEGILAFRANLNHSILAFLTIVATAALYATSSHGRSEWRMLCKRQIQRWQEFAQGTGKTPWLTTFIAVGAPMAIVCLLNGRSMATFDNYGIQLTAASLVMEGNPDFSKLAGVRSDKGVDCDGSLTYSRVCTSSGLYAATPAGMLLFLLPVFGISRIVGADLHNHRVLWRLAKWTAAWVAAGCLTLFFLIALRIAGLHAAVIGSIFLGLGSALWSTIGQGVWSHGGVCFGLLLGLWALFVLAAKKEIAGGLLIGTAWAVMFASRNTSATMIILFACWLIGKPRSLIAAALTGTAGLGLLSLYYHQVYGNYFGPQVAAFSGAGTSDYALSIFPEGFYGLLLSPGTGLFIYQIWLVFLFFPARQSTQSAPSDLPAHWKPLLLAMSTSQLLLYSCFRHWDGQWCWGTRYLSETIPLLALALLPNLSGSLSSPRGRQLAYSLAAIAFLIHLNGTSMAGSQWHHHPLDANASMEVRSLDWSDPAFLYPLPRWLWGPK